MTSIPWVLLSGPIEFPPLLRILCKLVWLLIWTILPHLFRFRLWHRSVPAETTPSLDLLNSTMFLLLAESLCATQVPVLLNLGTWMISPCSWPRPALFLLLLRSLTWPPIPLKFPGQIQNTKAIMPLSTKNRMLQLGQQLQAIPPIMWFLQVWMRLPRMWFV